MLVLKNSSKLKKCLGLKKFKLEKIKQKNVQIEKYMDLQKYFNLNHLKIFNF
jgi:hypothetical protein